VFDAPLRLWFDELNNKVDARAKLILVYKGMKDLIIVMRGI